MRYLHRVFQRNGTTPSAFVRQRRLSNCSRDLGDPTPGHLPIHAIARGWGYWQADVFSRVFRSFTGLSPREYRAGSRALSPLRDTPDASVGTAADESVQGLEE